MNAPPRYNQRANGLGVWTAFDRLLGKPIAEVCKELKALGVKWVAPRVGDYGKLQVSAAHFEDWRKGACDNGLGLFPWFYSRPQFYMREVDLIEQLLGMGATGVIVDAEIEWTNKHAEAEAYGRAARDRVGDAYIAHAPLAWLSYHPAWPFKQFGEWVDQTHPQTYWTELKHGSYSDCVTGCLEPWERLEAAGDIRAHGYAPIGVTYGRDELKARGGPPCPGKFEPADLAAFLERYGGQETLSLYSWELAGAAVRDALRARVDFLQGMPTDPETLAPIHGTHVVDASLEEYQRDEGKSQ
jgi:hypothetical protein